MMKILVSLSFVLLTFSSLEARDLTYKIGAGYKQIYSNGFVDDDTKTTLAPNQLNGIVLSYGIAPDLQVEGYFGFSRSFDSFATGPTLRYDFQRLISRNASIWNYLNLFTQLGFFVKAGTEVEAGIILQAPYFGFEVLPFSQNDFAIQTGAGLTVDLVEDNSLGFTDGMFGDVGVKFYF